VHTRRSASLKHIDVVLVTAGMLFAHHFCATMRTGLTILMALHATIHILGFVKWSAIADVPQLAGKTLLPFSATAGLTFAVLWLSVFAVLALAVALRIGHHERWWLWALGGALLSQVLIVVAWDDAKFGTMANVLILVPVIVAAAHAQFVNDVSAEVQSLLVQAPASQQSVVQLQELRNLPPPVRSWLEASGVVGHARARRVYLKQRGALRTSVDAAWMPAKAEQFFTVAEPAFIWRVDATMMGILPFAGRDKYSAGTGHMLIKAASLVKVVDASDSKIAQGALLRFLGEIVWFPTAALSPYIAWQPIDPKSAKATLRHAGLSASAIFHFNEQGQVLGIDAERYLGGGPDAKLTPWSVSCTEWRVTHGFQIPVRGDVSWKLDKGNFSYYRWEILDVQYNHFEGQ